VKYLVIAQAIIGRLLTAAAQVQSQDISCGICGGQSDIEAGILLALRDSLPHIIPSHARFSV
jgi:hypothetical protein